MRLQASGITVSVAGRKLLDDVAVSAEPGTVTGLIGPNGAGKSTLLGCLSGDTKPDSGELRLGDVDPFTSSPKEMARIRSVMLQDVNVSFSFLVRDVVEMGRRPWRGTQRAADNDMVVDAALRATHVDHLQSRDIMTLSGGERARVAMARVLAQQTPVVLLDEPTAALDISHQEQILGLVRRMSRQSGAVVIVVLHDLEAAAAYCDQVVCLKNGRVAAAGGVGDVYQSSVLSDVYDWPIQVSYGVDGDISVIPKRVAGDGEYGSLFVEYGE